MYISTRKLHKLCQDGNLKKVKKHTEQLSDVELVALSGRTDPVFCYTALHQAASGGKVEVLAYLLKRTGNAHVNCRANSGYTPLHLAASSGHKDCVRLLIEHGANINTVDEYGKDSMANS